MTNLIGLVIILTNQCGEQVAPSALKDRLRRPAMKKYECTVCGYVYDPAKGDPDRNIPPGTPFEQLPDDWVCPDCGATKDMFQPLD